MKRNNIISISVYIIICLGLLYIPNGFNSKIPQNNAIQEKAKVIEVNNIGIQNLGLISTGNQKLKVKILSGKCKNQIVKTNNILYGSKKRDNIFSKGDIISLIVDYKNDSKSIKSTRANGYYRINTMTILFIIFSLFLLCFAGWTGIKALLSFIFTAIWIWKFLIPMYILEYNPFLASLLTVIITTSAIIFMVGGFNKKGLVAFLGATVGVIFTAILAFTFGYYFQLPGEVMEFSETLKYAGFQDINFSQIFLSCIFISATGAVMDIAMDIAASQHEIVYQNNRITTKDLIISGFNIGRPVIGTMTTTLLFAYSGSFMVVFMAFISKGIPFSIILNINYISAEILKVLVGSFGLILVAPITAIIGGLIYSTKNKK